jgi:hypothetical protein
MKFEKTDIKILDFFIVITIEIGQARNPFPLSGVLSMFFVISF